MIAKVCRGEADILKQQTKSAITQPSASRAAALLHKD